MKKKVPESHLWEPEQTIHESITMTLADTAQKVEDITHPEISVSDVIDVISEQIDLTKMNWVEIQVLLDAFWAIRSGRSWTLSLSERTLLRTSLKRVRDTDTTSLSANHWPLNDTRPKLH